MLATRTGALVSFSLSLLTACGGGAGDGNGGPRNDSGGQGDGAVAAGCENLAGEGNAVGQIAADWTLLDRAGNPVNLHAYCGKVIYIENGAEW